MERDDTPIVLAAYPIIPFGESTPQFEDGPTPVNA